MCYNGRDHCPTFPAQVSEVLAISLENDVSIVNTCVLSLNHNHMLNTFIYLFVCVSVYVYVMLLKSTSV